jgi:hypothetical protein
MYPILMNHAARILPRWILTGSIGWIAGFGQAGSALLPFAWVELLLCGICRLMRSVSYSTGALASKFGIGALQPLCVDDVMRFSPADSILCTAWLLIYVL